MQLIRSRKIIIAVIAITFIAIVIVVIIIAADIFIIIFKESVINKSLFKNIHFAVTVKIKKPVIKKSNIFPPWVSLFLLL